MPSLSPSYLALLSRLVLGLVILCSCLPLAGAEKKKPTQQQIDFFESEVRPVLAKRCYSCHGAKKQKGGLRLDSLSSILTGGVSGTAMTPGSPGESLLIEAINYDGFEMPPNGKLEEKEIAALSRWVEIGSPWPGGDANQPAPAVKTNQITDEDRAFWSFQRLQKPLVPQVNDEGWSRTDVDRFIFRKLQAEGLTPADEADKMTLLRRAYFDLHGLPPTIQEMEAYLADDKPDAYRRLIDRLLESPRYGERWARHWLDLVRYSESDGYNQDAYRPEAWRYRDYVINTFNNDKPYDRFVMEQLAGDEIAPHDPQAIVATGFLRHGIYEYNQRDVRTQWGSMIDDVTNVTGDVFFGLSLACARCHDHKFDPILREDYFRLRSFFAGLVFPEDSLLGTPEEQADYQNKLALWTEKTTDLRKRIDEFEKPHKDRVTMAAIVKFPLDIRPILLKPDDQRAPLGKQLAELSARQLRLERQKLKFSSLLKGEQKTEWEALKKQLSKFDPIKPMPLPRAHNAIDIGPQSPPTSFPGDLSGKIIEPGYLAVLSSKPMVIVPPALNSQSTGRRTALARWLTQPDHPLTARVMVNRIWKEHFGQGIVATPSNFGELGTRPTHRELLDYLAMEFVESGWSIKSMHRLMMNSSVYRQSALRQTPQVANIKDPNNHWLWRMNIRRLEAEPIRDSILAATGELDLSQGGPSVEFTQPRRTIYTKKSRNKRFPLLVVFDAPDGFASVAQRNITTTPTQSLLMINGPWPLERAKALANRITSQPHDSPKQLIERAYLFVFGRRPTGEELSASSKFLKRQTASAAQETKVATKKPPLTASTASATIAEKKSTKSSQGEKKSKPKDPLQTALIDFCHVLLNSNEFLYID